MQAFVGPLAVPAQKVISASQTRRLCTAHANKANSTPDSVRDFLSRPMPWALSRCTMVASHKLPTSSSQHESRSGIILFQLLQFQFHQLAGCYWLLLAGCFEARRFWLRSLLAAPAWRRQLPLPSHYLRGRGSKHSGQLSSNAGAAVHFLRVSPARLLQMTRTGLDLSPLQDTVSGFELLCDAG